MEQVCSGFVRYSAVRRRDDLGNVAGNGWMSVAQDAKSEAYV